jgi:large subunit ribosomal protein L18
MMTNAQRNLQSTRARRVARVRARITGTSERPRLAVSRTLRHIVAQMVDDVAGRTVVSASDRDVKGADTMKPIDVAREVGKIVAARAGEAKVSKAVFDRRGKRYHGRVKALAEGAREGGLVF